MGQDEKWNVKPSTTRPYFRNSLFLLLIKVIFSGPHRINTIQPYVIQNHFFGNVMDEGVPVVSRSPAQESPLHNTFIWNINS
jgi:hypothetical protein